MERVAIFLDRDGVICKNRPDYVKSWAEFVFLPGAKKAVARLSEAGLDIVIVTNQSSINRGIVSTKVVDEINQRMICELEKVGGKVKAVFVCPHRPEEGCDCRKPRPGLLKQAAGELDLDLEGCYLVGDSSWDIEAGRKVGCRTVLVLSGLTSEEEAAEAVKADYVALDLEEAAHWIIKDAQERKVESGK